MYYMQKQEIYKFYLVVRSFNIVFSKKAVYHSFNLKVFLEKGLTNVSPSDNSYPNSFAL